MFFSKAWTAFLSLATTSLATTVTYDVGYDLASRGLDFVSCSDGSNGLIKKYGWHTQGDIPWFPFIGGAEAVEGWNSVNCGTCWAATFENRTIYVLAIDHTGHGLNVALEAMQVLTDGNAVHLGRVEADVKLVSVNFCGL